MNHPATRDSINLEEAIILDHEAYAGDQYLLRLHAPEIAKAALAGNFVHLRCDNSLPMRRPMSIMRAHQQQGWIDILYKVHGLGTRLLAQQRPNEQPFHGWELSGLVTHAFFNGQLVYQTGTP